MKKHLRFAGFLILLWCFSCKSQVKSPYKVDVNKERNYDEYKEYELESLDSFYNVSSDKYFIYLYSTECIDCEQIKNFVLSYYDLNEENLPKMYKYNMHSMSSEVGIENRSKFAKNEYSWIYNANWMIENHPSSMDETYFCGTPSLYVINNNILEDFVYDIEPTKAFIEKYLLI